MSYKTAVIITDQDVQPEEFSYPLYRLIEEGFVVDLWLTGAVTATDKSGTGLATLFSKSNQGRIITDVAQVIDYDVTIIPGGFAPERVRLNQGVLYYLRHCDKHQRIIGAICHGPQVLMSAGVLKDKNSTCFIGVKDDLINAGGKYAGPGVYVDGNLVTADHYRENPMWMKKTLELYDKYTLAHYVGM